MKDMEIKIVISADTTRFDEAMDHVRRRIEMELPELQEALDSFADYVGSQAEEFSRAMANVEKELRMSNEEVAEWAAQMAETGEDVRETWPSRDESGGD